MWDKSRIMPAIQPFTDEQARTLVNLRQRYEVWIEAEQALFALPYDLRRKSVGGRDYLYEITDRSGNGSSLGRWDDIKAAQFDAYKIEKARLKARSETARAALTNQAVSPVLCGCHCCRVTPDRSCARLIGVGCWGANCWSSGPIVWLPMRKRRAA